MGECFCADSSVLYTENSRRRTRGCDKLGSDTREARRFLVASKDKGGRNQKKVATKDPKQKRQEKKEKKSKDKLRPA